LTRCFVIGPIGNKFAPLGSPERESYEEALDVFENVILPACQAYGLEPVRADQIALTGEINDQIFRHLFEDEVVIADVSGGNPNVMYELGLRHTRPLLTIQLGEYGQLPFDVQAVRTIQFSRSERGLIDARKALERVLAAGLSDPGEGVAATRIWGGSHAGEHSDDPTEVAEQSTQDPDDLNEDGFLERMAALEMRLPALTKTTENIGTVVEEMGAVAASSSAEISALNGSSVPMAQRLTYVAKFAKALQPSADELTTATNSFLTDMNDLDTQLRGIFDYIENHPQVLKNADVDSFLGGISGMTRASREAMENINQFGSAMDGLAGMSRVLRKPSQQISAAVRTMLTAILLMDSWDEVAARIKQKFAAEGQDSVS
jgi:ABC-type transporter Mla subunit MlaD